MSIYNVILRVPGKGQGHSLQMCPLNNFDHGRILKLHAGEITCWNDFICILTKVPILGLKNEIVYNLCLLNSL